VLDLDEGEVERLGVDHIVLDALPPRIRKWRLSVAVREEPPDSRSPSRSGTTT
jgi:hypothetical protein